MPPLTHQIELDGVSAVYKERYRIVCRNSPVEASTKMEKLLVPTLSPHITRHAGFGNCAVYSSKNDIGLSGFFFS